MPVDIETVIALAGIQVAVNAPFFLLAIASYVKTSRIEGKCPKCTNLSGDEMDV